MDLQIKSSVYIGDTFDDIERSIELGMQSSRKGLERKLEEVAQERIRETGAIWKGELISSFDSEYTQSGDKYVLIFKNTAEHAPPIEFGAEYEEKGPPVAALVPWVQTKLRGFSLPDDDMPEARDVESIRDEAMDEATNQNMVDAVSLAEPETLERAFWLQQHIKENGIDAVRFMKAAELWAEESGDREVAKYINMYL